jgi:hypothetical protein
MNIIINGKIAINDPKYLDPSKIKSENKLKLKMLIDKALNEDFYWTTSYNKTERKSKNNYLSDDNIQKINNIKTILRTYYRLII